MAIYFKNNSVGDLIVKLDHCIDFWSCVCNLAIIIIMYAHLCKLDGFKGFLNQCNEKLNVNTK